MKIGIISKEAHAKSHAAALEQAGFLPVMLGSRPTEIPPTVPIVVCRTLSCSHGAMDTALAWHRAGKGALIVENGVSSIVRKAAIIRDRANTESPEPVEPVSEVPDHAEYGDLLSAGAEFLWQNPKATHDEVLAALQEAYPQEDRSLLLSVVAALPVVAPVLPEPVPLPDNKDTPMPLPSDSLKKPYPSRFQRQMSESTADSRMETAWNLRESMTPEQVQEVGAWVEGGAVGPLPHSNILNRLTGNPVGFVGLMLLCASQSLALRDVSRAYMRVTGKQLFGRMAEIAAWWLNMNFKYATNTIRKTPARKTLVRKTENKEPLMIPKPTDAPSPAPDAPTLAALQALSKSLDGLLAKMAELDGRVGELNTRIDNMTRTPVLNNGTPTTGDALAALAAKGLEVVVRPSSR